VTNIIELETPPYLILLDDIAIIWVRRIMNNGYMNDDSVRKGNARTMTRLQPPFGPVDEIVVNDKPWKCSSSLE
jgi:hypothetical protein